MPGPKGADPDPLTRRCRPASKRRACTHRQRWLVKPMRPRDPPQGRSRDPWSGVIRGVGGRGAGVFRGCLDVAGGHVVHADSTMAVGPFQRLPDRHRTPPRVRNAQARSRSASTRPAPADDAAVSHDHFGLPLLAFGPLLLRQGPWTHSLVVQSIVALVRHSAETCLQIGRQSVVFHLPLFSQVRILFAGKNRIRQQWHASNLKLLARRGEQPGWFTRTARCGMSSSCPHTMR